jgi:hypothetical protein
LYCLAKLYNSFLVISLNFAISNSTALILSFFILSDKKHTPVVLIEENGKILLERLLLTLYHNIDNFRLLDYIFWYKKRGLINNPL